jgi:hypothetical protein
MRLAVVKTDLENPGYCIGQRSYGKRHHPFQSKGVCSQGLQASNRFAVQLNYPSCHVCPS